MFKTAVTFAFILASAVPAMASDNVTTTAAAATTVMPIATAIENAVTAAASETPAADTPQLMLGNTSRVSGRGSLLPVLYGGLAALNAYDAYTTTKGISRGATEANGLMSKAAGSSKAMWAVKGSLTAGSILLAEHLWKTNRRGQAIGMMLVTNGLMAFVGAQNTNVLRNQR